MPVALKTVAASGAAAAFRILLMPVDATKTIMQAGGAHCLFFSLVRLESCECHQDHHAGGC